MSAVERESDPNRDGGREKAKRLYKLIQEHRLLKQKPLERKFEPPTVKRVEAEARRL